MRYLITFSYDGSKYNGYQKQPKGKTIQNEIETVLTHINGNQKVSIHASGRTDAGVHANHQKAHFDLQKEWDSDKLKSSLNSLLPPDIYIQKVELVSDEFHARFDVISKEYVYKINMGEYNPIEKDYIYQYNQPLKLVEMERALKYIEGTHNFKSFTKADAEQENYVRTIYKATLIRDRKNLQQIQIVFRGDGFMRYMVRNLVGVLIEIGSGKRKSKDILTILKAEDRTKSGKTAPACGLYLNDVFY